ncbi:MAG: LamG domain-containing protein [Lentisphaerae bacterium]|nr:LamG domain-containing protein [Lentisphaerota bacterium]
MTERSQLLRKLRRLALWGLAGVTAAVIALLAALWVSARADPVPTRRFTYRDGTFDYYFGWENADLLVMYPNGNVQRETVAAIPVQIATNEWADLFIVYTLGNGRIYGVSGEASIVDRTGRCLWIGTINGMLEDFFKPDCWWLRLADVDGDGRAEAVVTSAENEEGETWTKERCLKTVAVHTQIERLDGKQTPVDARSLSRWRRLRFNLWRFRTPDDVPGCGDDTASESPDEEASTSWFQCTAAMERRLYAESRDQEQARQERLRMCAAPYPADIRLLVEEAYDAAKRHAERYAVLRNRHGGSGVLIAIMLLQEQICERTVALIEHVCARRLEALGRAPDDKGGQAEESRRTEQNLFRPYSDTDRADAAFTRLFARLLPEVPAPDVRRHVAATLRPERDPYEMILFVEYRSSDLMRICAYPRGTAQEWTPPELARTLLEAHEQEVRRLEALARQGDPQSLERVLDLLVFNPRSFFSADPVRAQDIYQSVKAAHPGLRLEGEPKIELTLYLSASTPFDWGDRRAYWDTEEVDLDLWGDGEPGYLLSLAWHYAHDPAFRWDFFQRILARSGGGRDALYANLRHAYLYAQEHCTWDQNVGDLFAAGTAGIAFDTPREIGRYLAYHERRRSAYSEHRDAYRCGKRFVALQTASETHFLGPGGRLRHAAHENALLQDMALDLMLLEEGMLTPIPGDERRTWDEYRRLRGEVTALIESGGQGGMLPDAAAFAVTQQAWEAYCRAFIDAASTWSDLENDLVTKDAWLVWLLEKRILQLRRLKNRILE